MKSCLTGLFLWAPFVLLYAQNLPEWAPQSPETFAFSNYSNPEIHTYTGKPNISIPIHTVKGKEMDWSIDLAYDAGGVKVTQLASAVGLGWNLNYGGVVSRRVHGHPDEVNAGITTKRNTLHHLREHPNIHGIEPNWQDFQGNMNLLSFIGQNDVDTEADTFTFNVQGFSGTIGIDYDVVQNGLYRVFCYDRPDVAVKYTGSGTDISSWEIIDENGTKYVFQTKELTRQVFSDEENEYVYYYTSAWYLTKLVSPVGKDVFDFVYQPGAYWQSDRNLSATETRQTKPHFKNNCTGSLDHWELITTHGPYNKYAIKQPEIKFIKYNNRLVLEAFWLNDRADIPGKGRMTKIRVNTMRDIGFEQSYFKTSENVSPQNTNSYQDHVRLKLNEVRFYDNIIGLANTKKEYGYRMEYEGENSMPDTRSYAQDLLGYYNGSNNTGLVPGLTHLLDSGDSYLTTYSIANSGADRRPDLNYAKKGVLKKLYYPTGGYTEYEYELHQSLPEYTSKPTSDYQKFTLYGGVNPPVGSYFEGCIGDEYDPDSWVNPNRQDDNNFMVMYLPNNSGYVSVDFKITVTGT
ncbi:MAG: hypothetical protein VXW38_16740, partial [Bacteroidota bacterium]|nr:hypothetical protein [Bacteroidota bacterium]